MREGCRSLLKNCIIQIENNDSLKSNDDGTDSFQVRHIFVESIRVVHRKAES